MKIIVRIGVILGITLIWSCNRYQAQAPPNIILILADDLGYGDVETYNPESKIPTPHLNDLASEGIHFTHAHAPAALCTPTRYSLLTGRYAWRSRMKRGVLWFWDPPLIEKGRLTMGGMLQQKSYHTAIIGKWHLGWEWPTVDGESPTLKNGVRNVDYSRKIGRGPLAHGFNYYFGDDVPGFPPMLLLKMTRWLWNPRTGTMVDRVPADPRHRAGHTRRCCRH